MATPFLVPFVTGALTELQEQKRVSDEIAGSVVDNVSKHVLGVEIPAERKLIKSQESLKNQYADRFGSKVAVGMDAMGLFETGTEEGLFKAVRITFGDKYSIDEIAKKIDATSDEDYSKLASKSFIGNRKKALEDRASHIDKVLGDTANIKDLLIDKKPTGLAKFIGEPLGKGDEATAKARLTQELEGPTAPVTTTGVNAASILSLDKGAALNFSNLGFKDRKDLKSAARLEYNTTQERFGGTFKKEYQAGYDPKIHNPMGILNADTYAFENYFQNYYLPFTAEVKYDGARPIGQAPKKETIAKTTQLVDKAKKPKVKSAAPKGEFQPQITTEAETETTGEQFNNDARVALAQEAINKARAANNESAVEAIKDQLRKDLGVNNLSGLIK